VPGPWNTGGSAASEDMPRKPGTENRERATIGRRKDKQGSRCRAAVGGSLCRHLSAGALCIVQSISDARDRRISCEIGCHPEE
jgi:hypothetical protein